MRFYESAVIGKDQLHIIEPGSALKCGYLSLARACSFPITGHGTDFGECCRAEGSLGKC